MKFNKKMPLILGGLAAIALGSVGFASWIITGATPGTIEQFDVSVGELEDRSYTIKNALISADNSVTFDSKNNSSISDRLFVSNEDKEDLTFGFGFDVVCGENTAFDFTYFSGVNVKLTSDYASYASLLDTKIRAPFAETGTEIAFTSDSKTVDGGKHDGATSVTKYTATIGAASAGTIHVDVTASFAWGSEFKNNNPSNLTKAGNNLETIKTAIKAVQNLNTKHFKLTITPTLKK